MDVTLDQYNQRIKQWVSKTRADLRQSIAGLSSKGKGELLRSLFGKTSMNYGEIESIVYSFNRYGVFFHKGVGKGYYMAGGKVVRGLKPGTKVKKGIGYKLTGQRKSAFAGGGSWYNTVRITPREPKEWFNPVLDRRLPELANMVAEMRADMAIQEAAIKIN